LPGPDAAALAGAAGMSPEEQAGMVRGMVEGLATRLSQEGGSAEEWARLIASYGVLGETEKAAAVLAEAETIFAADPQGLALIRAAGGDR
jgi:cytochrome c-type biogenesis protein CcmH